MRKSSISIDKLLRLKIWPEAIISSLDHNLKQVECTYKDSPSNVTLSEAIRFPTPSKEYLTPPLIPVYLSYRTY